MLPTRVLFCVDPERNPLHITWDGIRQDRTVHSKSTVAIDPIRHVPLPSPIGSCFEEDPERASYPLRQLLLEGCRMSECIDRTCPRQWMVKRYTTESAGGDKSERVKRTRASSFLPRFLLFRMESIAKPSQSNATEWFFRKERSSIQLSGCQVLGERKRG